jgi:hypothetical protein
MEARHLRIVRPARKIWYGKLNGATAQQMQWLKWKAGEGMDDQNVEYINISKKVMRDGTVVLFFKAELFGKINTYLGPSDFPLSWKNNVVWTREPSEGFARLVAADHFCSLWEQGMLVTVQIAEIAARR